MTAVRRLAFCALLSLAIAPAAAQPRSGNVIDMHARADGNRDGAVTEAELRGFRRDAFDRLDVSKDWRLSRTDVTKWALVMGSAGARAQFDQFLATLDTDGDGMISRAEFIDGRSPAFEILDADHNQTVDVAEFAAGRAALAAPAQP